MSSSLLELDDDTDHYLINIRHNESANTNDYFDYLCKKGIIVPDKMDEFGLLYFQTQAAIFNKEPEHVAFTIVLTDKCNYACKYCFENHPEKATHTTNIDSMAVIEFLKEQINNNKRMKSIRITWFGGEPMCNADAITYITKELTLICEDRNITYKASIISNGRLLDPDFLIKNRISSAQITLDGLAPIYAQYKGGSEKDFYYVMEVIKSILQYEEISLGIRLNCDRGNLESIRDLIKLLDDEKILEKAYISLAMIHTGTESELSEKEFYDLQLDYYKYLKKKNYHSILKKYIPKSRLMSCGFIGAGSYVIDSNGSLKKCERHVGLQDKTVGDLCFGNYYNGVEIEFKANDMMEKCVGCNLYPICRGGCKERRMKGYGIDCDLYRQQVKDILTIISEK